MTLSSRLIFLLSVAAAAKQQFLSYPLSYLLDEKPRSTVPDYVQTFAPLVWFHSEEKYFPSDIGSQVDNTRPEIDFAVVEGYPTPLTLDNLDSLNANNGTDVYLTSKEDITKAPAWLNGVKPDTSGKTEGAVSATVIVNDHGNGHADVFYMYFTAFNWGGTVLGQEVNEHVGDWEHNMIRFVDGTPTQVWYSQHGFGQAFTYDCLEKQGSRPIAYSGNGSHAVYAISGPHDHTIPNVNLPNKGLLTDYTDQGTLWDPLLSAYFYSFDAGANAFTSYDPAHPTAWLRYVGKWGDQQFPDDDPRQSFILPGVDATARHTGGPTGPQDKQLNRTDVCPEAKGYVCNVRKELSALEE